MRICGSGNFSGPQQVYLPTKQPTITKPQTKPHTWLERIERFPECRLEHHLFDGSKAGPRHVSSLGRITECLKKLTVGLVGKLGLW